MDDKAEESGEKRKKNIFLFIIVVLAILIIIAGAFLFWPKEENPKEESAGKTEFLTGYSITGGLVENKEYGFSLVVPNGWIVKDYGEEIGLFSPEIEFDENGAFLKNAEEKGGCVVGVSIVKTDTEYLASMIEGIKLGDNFLDTEDVKNEVITISGKEGLKITYFKENEQKYAEINVPAGNLIYSFRNGIIFSEKCVTDFNKILGTIVISK